jgi:hypothetical protein
MVNPNPSFLSKRVKKRDPSGITSDRYEFLGLDQAEPDLGDPLVGPSSVGVNPYTGSVSELYVLVSDTSKEGKRYWTRQPNIIEGGIVSPGSITVRNKGDIVGSANQITDLNFVGTGVTIVNPASWVGAGSSSVDIEISVTDFIASGDQKEVQIHGPLGFVEGADEFVYDYETSRVGIGSTTPTRKLDVNGDVVISGELKVGFITALTGNFAESLRVGNFEISDTTTFVRITSGSVGIGTTNPKAALDVNGTVNISGVATITEIKTDKIDSSSYFVDGVQIINSSRNINNIPSATINQVNAGFITATNSFISGVITATSAKISTLDVGFGTFTNSFVSGVSTVGVLTANSVFSNFIKSDEINSNSIGIGTTSPRSELEVVGDIRLSGAIYAVNGSGSIGQVLISGGPDSVTWGNPSEVTAGAANSIFTRAASDSGDYYLSFLENNQESIQYVYFDQDSLKYNPSTNTLTVDNIVANDLQLEGLSRYTTGIVTTNSKNEIVIDQLNTDVFRSARYSVQVNTIGQLILNNGNSVSTLQSGTNYYPGIYKNIFLTNINSSGIDATANITVTPEATLSIVGSFSGVFTTPQSLTGVTTSQSLVFNGVLLPSEFENSRVTNINLTNVGSGYTTIPTFIFSAPIIENNPVEGVGVGSTATGVVNSANVSNIVFNNPGFVTSLVPTITVKSPNNGTTATAQVGYGISTISVTNSGVGYISIPTVNFSSGLAIAGVSTVFVNKLRATNPGFGYTIGDLNTNIVFNFGSAAATNASFSLPNSHLGFNISNPGIGYTTPPLLIVGAPQIGINTGIATCTLGISTFTVTSPGTGYTVSPSISNEPSVSGFNATVGLGVSNFAIQVNGGSGYTSPPTIIFVPVGGIGTGAQGEFTSSNPDEPRDLQNFVITNPGFGYTVPPNVIITGGGGVGAAVTIRTMVVTNVTVNSTGFGANEVVSTTLSTNPIEFLDNPFTKTGTVGIATTSRVNNVIFTAQGTLSIASTTIISGISTFNTIIRQKNGDLDSINDTTITGIDTSNVSVGFAVTGNFVQAGTAVSFVSAASGGTIGLTTNLTNPTIGFGLTFFISDTLSERVIVGQGVSGTSIDQTEFGTTVVSIGNSTVNLSKPTTNTGIQTSNFNFGTLEIIPGVFQTNIITGINTSGISTGQRITGSIVQSNTNVSSIQPNSITIDKLTTNVSVSTTTFTLFTVVSAAGAGASIIPFMGIGRVTVGVDTTNPLNLGFGTGYTALPGIAVTAVDGITGGSGIVTTISFGIDTDCFSITNAGIYTAVPSALVTPPLAGGSAATVNVGVGVSTIIITSAGSYTGSKPIVSLSGGSPLVSAAATVNNIVLTGTIPITSSGTGYTSFDLPVTATFSNTSLSGTVGLKVENISITSSGLGYTETPTITFTDPTLSGGVKATANAVLANFGPEFSLFPGPGFGNTFVYYIEPISSNTFKLYRDINRTNQVLLGFSTLTDPIAFVGGEVTDVEIVSGGSGYEIGDVLSANSLNLSNTFSSNVGTGFSFTVVNPVENFQISDLMMLQTVGSANTSTHIIEYAGISNSDDLLSFSSDISGNSARLKVTPTYRDNTIKITRTSIAR